MRFITLYCVPLYPTSLGELKLDKISFPLYYQGFSDHTIGTTASMVAMARGAQYIEKHFTLNKFDSRGPDHICSVEPHELKELVGFARQVEEIL